ncbi:helix-turn-helix domain-containing protein [Dyella soli]|uniref:XRE family transcriptional regulator n=1 Tax=Dyella soli TaxID=522319 RepID=A0A4R0YM92_9GAMM|nr:helix-turn-helix transcriptional regulator [Dyella soli]TCI06869.1 XRE family transcriptional regulator [Dyella soli]
MMRCAKSFRVFSPWKSGAIRRDAASDRRPALERSALRAAGEKQSEHGLQVKLAFHAVRTHKNGLAIRLANARFNLPTKKATNPHAGFAERLQAACDAADIPAGRARSAALALRFAVSTEAVRQWLHGRAFPEVSRLVEMAEEFECSLDWLLLGRLPSSGQVREPGGAYKTLTAQERAVVSAMRKLNARRRNALVQLLAEG